MEDRTDQERSNANMNSLVENQVNADAPLLAKLDEIRSLLAEEPRCGRFEAMTKCDELRALVVPPAKQERFARKFKAQKKDQLHGVLDARAELDKDTLETLSVYVGEEMTDDQTLAVHAYAEAERDFGKPLSGSADDHVQEALFLLETYNLRNTYDLTHPEFFKLFVVTLKKTKTKDVVRAELPDIVQEALRTGGPSLTHEDLAFALTALLRIKKLNGTPWSESSDDRVNLNLALRLMIDAMAALEQVEKVWKMESKNEERDKEIAALKAKIEARDEKLGATKIEHAECEEQLKAKEAQLKCELAVCKNELGTKDNLLKFAKLELAACKEQLKAKDDLLKSKDEQLKLSMALVASKDELAKAKQAPKGKPLACVTNA